MNIATAILLYTFFASALILVIYYVFFFTRLKSDHGINKTHQSKKPPVSIIISAKNETVNLSKNIPLILSQDYPDFELIIINDGCNEETDQLIFDFMATDSRLSLTHVSDSQKMYSGKKLPLTLGIKKAKNDLLIFTDADCFPDSKRWLATMVQNFDRDIVIGFSPYTKEKGLLNRLIRFDATQTGMLYLSFAIAGKPYMGVGRNLGYTKAFFFKVGGFRSQYHIPSGDDDLFINKFITKDNYRVVLDTDSYVSSTPHTKWGSWWRQKRRHLSTATEYKWGSKLLLGLYHLSQVLFYLGLVLLLINHIYLWLVVSVYLIKTIIQLLISLPAYKKLKAPDLLALSPIYEPILLIVGMLVTISLRFTNKIRWK